MITVTHAQLVHDLQALGLQTGQVVFVHSSLGSLGFVPGGAETVVDALLAVLGPTGTLVAPTFTFVHNYTAEPCFDPQHDRSEMGAISEAVRRRAGARRSCHLLHSVAALGAQAEVITAVHGSSAWAADGPFWQLLVQDARILLLGVSYLRCTWFHVIEQLVQVPYRHWLEKNAWVRLANGDLAPLPTRIYARKPDFVGNDFNKFGALLEEAGKVQVGAVGNASARAFAVGDALALGIAHYRREPLLFVQTTPDYYPLRTGHMIGASYREQVVVDPAQVYVRMGSADENH